MSDIIEQIDCESAEIRRLVKLSTRITMAVCNGQPITRQEADELRRLELATGVEWDAINQEFSPVEGDVK